MRRIACMLCIMICTSVPAFTQILPVADSIQATTPETPGPEKIFKINLSAFLFKNLSLQYEWQIGKQKSMEINVRAMPFTKFLFPSRIGKTFHIKQIDFDEMKSASFALGAGMKFYMSEKPQRGFYLGPFINYAYYKLRVPLKFEFDKEKLAGFDGTFNAFSMGIQLGVHFPVSKKVSLDWWIIGSNLGYGSGNFLYKSPLTVAQQDDLHLQIREFRRDFFFGIIREFEVNAEGAGIKTSGTIAGLRGMGFNLGFKL